MDVKENLYSLLERGNESDLVQNCLQDFKHLVLSYSSRLIPVQEVRSIYSVRAIINSKKEVGIQGFDEPVPSLKSFEGQVVLHSLEDEHGKRYLIFTDETIASLIGLLKFPQ